MYYPFFLTYMVTGLGIGLIVFAWAVRNGQFSDQKRARFLALENRPAVAKNCPARGAPALYCLFFLAGAAIAASGALIVYALFVY